MNDYRSVFVSFAPKDDFTPEATKIHWYTTGSTKISNQIGAPKLVKISPSRFMLLWQDYLNNGTLKYLLLNGRCEAVSQIYTAKDVLTSNCQPIFHGGKVMWYTTWNSKPVYYTIDPANMGTVAVC